MHNDKYVIKESRVQLVQTHSLRKGLKKFGENGCKAAHGEMNQSYKQVVFEPISVDKLIDKDQKRPFDASDGSVKGRTCANGNLEQGYMQKEEANSPTAATESMLITGVIEAKEERDTMTLDIPNASVEASMEKSKVGERVIMKFRGTLVNLLCKIAPEVCVEHVFYENKKIVLHVNMLRPLCGMLIFSSHTLHRMLKFIA